MKYVLIEAINGQILIVDNSDSIGKKKVETLIMEGCKYIGTVDSVVNRLHLLAGFTKNITLKLEDEYEKLRKIRNVMEGKE